jgi:hypothetical protein
MGFTGYRPGRQQAEREHEAWQDDDGSLYIWWSPTESQFDAGHEGDTFGPVAAMRLA